MGDLTLTKVAASINRSQADIEKRQALDLFSSYGRDDQIKIAKCFEYLKQAEKATKVASEKGDLDPADAVAPMTPARRLKVAIELAHFNELVSNEELAKQAEEAAAAGALMSNLFVDYVKEAEGPPPEFVAMKKKMKNSEDGDGDGKKLEDTKGEHDNLPDSKKEDKKDKED